MRKLNKSVVVAAVAGVLVTGAAGTSAAIPYHGLTVEEFRQVQFGMTPQQVLDVVGAEACEEGGAPGTTITCWKEGREEFDPYAGFYFNDTGKLASKYQMYLDLPAAPSMTKAKYNKVAVGMTVDQVLQTVGTNSCAVSREAMMAYPSTAGHEIDYKCYTSQGTTFLSPYGFFDFKDGKLVNKWHYNLR
ncbi:BLIP family protein [Streptomyces sp. NPDC000410]|uniref:BLIP family protein n=1 Tax=Streptomyces sp. NPDC000410 TaxID=3154254 RepID=UPI00331B06FA